MILILSLCSISLALGRNASELLYCRCGMDHSDPYHRNSDTDCSVIQEWVSSTVFTVSLQFKVSTVFTVLVAIYPGSRETITRKVSG